MWRLRFDINIEYHIVREKLQSRLFHILPASSPKQLANFFTKLLEPAPFSLTLSKLGVLNIYSPT